MIHLCIISSFWRTLHVLFFLSLCHTGLYARLFYYLFSHIRTAYGYLWTSEYFLKSLNLFKLALEVPTYSEQFLHLLIFLLVTHLNFPTLSVFILISATSTYSILKLLGSACQRGRCLFQIIKIYFYNILNLSHYIFPITTFIHSPISSRTTCYCHIFIVCILFPYAF